VNIRCHLVSKILSIEELPGQCHWNKKNQVHLSYAKGRRIIIKPKDHFMTIWTKQKCHTKISWY
jgi:hypothetical protein